MGGDGTQFEYPDEAGYPDGMGVLHEGTDDEAEGTDDEAEGTDDEAEGTDDEAEGTEQVADAAEEELDGFAMHDEEDDDENV